MMSEHQVHV